MEELRARESEEPRAPSLESAHPRGRSVSREPSGRDLLPADVPPPSLPLRGPGLLPRARSVPASASGFRGVGNAPLAALSRPGNDRRVRGGDDLHVHRFLHHSRASGHRDHRELSSLGPSRHTPPVRRPERFPLGSPRARDRNDAPRRPSAGRVLRSPPRLRVLPVRRGMARKPFAIPPRASPRYRRRLRSASSDVRPREGVEPCGARVRVLHVLRLLTLFPLRNPHPPRPGAAPRPGRSRPAPHLRRDRIAAVRFPRRGCLSQPRAVLLRGGRPHRAFPVLREGFARLRFSLCVAPRPRQLPGPLSSSRGMGSRLLGPGRARNRVAGDSFAEGPSPPAENRPGSVRGAPRTRALGSSTPPTAPFERGNASSPGTWSV